MTHERRWRNELAPGDLDPRARPGCPRELLETERERGRRAGPKLCVDRADVGQRETDYEALPRGRQAKAGDKRVGGLELRGQDGRPAPQILVARGEGPLQIGQPEGPAHAVLRGVLCDVHCARRQAERANRTPRDRHVLRVGR